ncbi:F-box protein [Phanerochaete sordida]|uniref:F-box protein n=1 Tax=Phanerochaete sordida TaxID=48140 RepID=A0A9P3GP81_9APHY|nr:F-box protein [Phanerochaete sordida]
MKWGLDRLSVEVVVEILAYLDYIDLLSCRRVSRKFDFIVTDTLALQYKIELGMIGYEDGSANSSLLSRLASIQRERRAWKDLSLKHVQSISVPSQDWIEARSHKDVISGRIPDHPGQLDLMYLGSSFPEHERVRRIEFDTRFDAHYIDPGQDLVILASLTQPLDAAGMRPSPKVYLRTLTDQKPHPRARQSFIDLASYGFPATSFVRRAKIQVSGAYLAFTVQKSLTVEAIFVWHWPTCTILAALRSSHDTAYLTAFCTPDAHLLVNAYERGPRGGGFGVHVFALHADAEAPALLAAFALPRLQWDFSSWLTCTFFPGYQKHAQLAGGGAAPASAHPALRLVQLRVDLQYTVYALLSTFLSPAVLEDRHRRVPLRYAWSEWGPRGARVLREDEESIICGYKAVYPEYVLDFCPVTDPSDKDDFVTRDETVLETTVFAETVVTRLPFRKVPLSLGPLARNEMQLFFRDVDGPKIVRALCEDFILIPTSLDIYAIVPDEEPDAP